MHSEATRDIELLAQCFTSDAEVEDENRIYRGIDAIREWKRATHAKYQYTVTPLEAWPSMTRAISGCWRTWPARFRGARSS